MYASYFMTYVDNNDMTRTFCMAAASDFAWNKQNHDRGSDHSPSSFVHDDVRCGIT